MVRGELNMPSLLRMTVLDIGRGGVALLARARDTYRVGQQLLNCSFDLAEDGEFTTNLNVRHVERIEGLGGWCYGCSYAGISAAALARVSRYVERIEMRRRETLAEVA
jgi:c-di-GMP-binding flagellar brake protein YcgR